MTIFNIARLPQCTIGGIKVFYQESTVNGGRKTITHEYPDTDTRYVEDLGKLEKTYNIDAVVNTNVSFSARDKLIKVLESAGIIPIVHPTFGKRNVVLKSYSLIDSTLTLGICKFSLVFEEASLNKMPQTIQGNAGFLDKLKKSVLEKTGVDLDKTWKAVTDAKDKFDSAVETVSNTANEMQRASQLIQGAADSFSDLTTSINEIVDSARSLVQSPSILASKIRTSFNNLGVAYNSSKDLFDVCSSFFGFNGADRKSNGKSVVSRDIAANQSAIQNIYQVSALATAYSAAGNINYTTLDELINVVATLENGYNLLPNNVERETYKLLQQMRIEVMNIFNRLSIALPKVNSYNTNPISLNVLIYSLYGSLANKNVLKELNQFVDTTQISGTIKILGNG